MGDKLNPQTYYQPGNRILSLYLNLARGILRGGAHRMKNEAVWDL